MSAPRTQTRRTRRFSFRWRGRRWYDPNERKVVWPTLILVLATGLMRVLTLGGSAGQTAPLAAGADPQAREHSVLASPENAPGAPGPGPQEPSAFLPLREPAEALDAPGFPLGTKPEDARVTAFVKGHGQLGRGLDDRHGFKIRGEVAGSSGLRFTRSQQYFQGVRVLGGELVLRQGPNGAVAAAADTLSRDLSLNTAPSLGASECLAVALAELNPGGTFAVPPTAELVICPMTQQAPRPAVAHPHNAADFEKVVLRHELAYLVHVEIESPADTRHEDLLVQAHTGAILRRWSTLHTDAQQGTGRSEYSGSVALSTNAVAGGFELRDMLRSGSTTTNMGGGTSGMGSVYSNAVNEWGDGGNYSQANGSTSSNGQTAAVDAHYGMQVTWDFLNKVLGRNGIDGRGTPVTSRVHYSSNYDNAFWSDSCFCMTFGDGSMFKTLTALDVAAHEMGHGVCATTANLAYSGESGGLNEANSDILGVMVEFYARGAGGQGTTIPDTGGNWTMGEQLSTAQFPNPLRYMNKPSLDGRSPDAWSSSIAGLDVHFSSGPMNRAFYFLSQGASADAGSSSYSSYLPAGMKGLGNDKALRIWWRTLSTRLTPSSNYLDARNGAIAAAGELYGIGSPEQAAAGDAFAAINVGSAASPADTKAPTVTAKATGTSGSLTFTATATDNVGVTRVDYWVDGLLKGSATTTPYAFAFNATTLVNGNHSLVAKAFDAAGNVGSSVAVAFAVNNPDTTAPTVAANLASASGTLTFTATATDNLGIKQVKYLVDGTLKGSATVKPYTLTIKAATLPEGSHNLVAVALDAAGNAGTSSAVPFVVDLTAPVVIASETGTSGILTFSATATDARGVTKVDFLVDGILKGTTSSSPFTFAFDSKPLTNGTHSLVAKAYDAAGNKGSSPAVSFALNNPDTTAPSVAAKVSLAAGLYTATATATDNVGVTRVDYLLDGTLLGSATVKPYTFTFRTPAVSEGAHSVTARAHDAAGNAGNAPAVTITVDLTAPSVVPSVANAAGAYTFTASAKDNVGVAQVDYLVNGILKGTSRTSPFALAIKGTALTSGSNSLVARASDAAGNVGSSSAVSFNVDNQAPKVAAAVLGTAGILSFTATASDDLGVVRVDYLVDGVIKGSASTDPYACDFDSKPLVNGVHKLVAKAYDAAGNIGLSLAVPFTLNNPDITAPSVTAKVAFASGTFTATATATDKVGVARVDYLLDGNLLGGSTIKPYTFAFKAATLPEGAHSLVARAYDAAGNGGQSPAIAIQIDNTAPSISASVTCAAPILTFTATALDNVRVTKVDYFVDGVLKGSASSTPYKLAIKAATLTNGNHSLVAKAWDAAGNAGISSSVTFAVDNLAPQVSARETGTSGTIVFSATASDNVGVLRVDFFVDGALKASAAADPFTVAFDSSALSNAGHQLVAKAYDAAGNVGTSAAYAFMVNNALLAETESNDSPTTANRIATTVMTVVGALPAAHDVDTYAVVLAAGKTTQIALMPPAGLAYGIAQVQGAAIQGVVPVRSLAGTGRTITFPAVSNPSLTETIVYIQVYSPYGHSSSSNYTIAVSRR